MSSVPRVRLPFRGVSDAFVLPDPQQTLPERTRRWPRTDCATALIDRLIHHAEIITIEGDGYRRRAAEVTRKAPRPKSSS